MTNSFFYYTKLSDFRPVLWPGGHVFKQYSLIKNHLRINLGPAYADLLSNPVISDQDLIEGKMVSWTSEVLSDKSESFSDLSADVKEKVTDILESRLKSVHAYINFLRNTNDFDNQKWADLIEKSFHIPSLSFLMVDGENISLVLWGFENVQHNSKQINTLNVFAKKFNPSDFIIKKSLTADSSNIQLEEIVGATNPIDVRTKQASIANQEEIKPSTTAYQTTTFPNPLESAVVSSTTRNRTAFVNAGYDYKKGLWLLFFLFKFYFQAVWHGF